MLTFPPVGQHEFVSSAELTYSPECSPTSGTEYTTASQLKNTSRAEI
ncbi:hypothetical protein C900_00668 [Fulvivirga imtechensis AK7]|uniref:Uncharacterized protein n=1 Tax=Fulvivirga imtechensis AK7 TaxID=1237149 RepID=L8JIW8_9BACT|nr:hypothetical protein C900_00668 [Fulvivirga imtechensis AK7]